MIPVIALVGRPNVGKSTLFNQLTRSRDALVADLAGLTRDRKYGEARIGSRPFIVIDTGGISGDEMGIEAQMAGQSLLAIEEADAVLFLVSARDGLNPADQALARHLRQRNKAFHVVVNKIDGLNEDVVLGDFYALGVEHLHGIAATHGRGVRQMIDDVLATFPEDEAEDAAAVDRRDSIRVAIVGRPNVGKSTLVNRLLGEERVVVYDQPGTTRDSVYIDYERDGQRYTLIDTAGVRRRKNVRETVEKFSIVKTLKAIDDAHVVLLVMDAHEGIVDQDLHLLGHCIEAGRGLVLAVNKWDGIETHQRDWIRNELSRRLIFADYADTHFISALHGTGVGHLYKSILGAHASATRKLSTNQLTRILEGAVFDHAPPMVNGRRIKLRYAHPGGQNPPLIVIHGNQTGNVPNSYQRYLENVFRRELKLSGTPVRIEFRTGDNPFADKRNQLTQRQVQRKRRLMAHVKKNDRKKKR
ncbi:MAG: ribosome biogenesis GTPase Der [Haliea sp.]|mgnify:FL=1|jgi:GTP-binding protein|uniref:ribosome biogenesis GTPase Der n=1 Tax=Haliea sp. TaxID=1932666 RepID=UPI000C5ECE16|nr:ribosome biogenesis GTPase Der [Haliea sp.]MBM70599.1 ribosome biogenesis GTPase Der [Haliea sp.]|tara:strand:+ start:9741 stop:11156 length:1416 start_codon:yes stop_codon:yes gene_type:complete